jgi:tRNA(Ile)-lysidine synthase
MKNMSVQRHPLFHRIALAVQRQSLILPRTGLLVAVSGGPDSVCLLAVLDELRTSGWVPELTLHIAHVNYGLRSTESDQDEEFVRELGHQLGLPVHCERVRLQHGTATSLQAEARAARYAIFEQLCRRHGLAAVATGHTADDQAETLLLWLLRGSGLKGLAGIPMTREGWVIRPLLHERRADLLDYLAARGLGYRTDSSNMKSLYQRNRIRRELLPQLHGYNPRIVETLARTSEILAEDAALLDEIERDRWSRVALQNGGGRVVLDCQQLAAFPLSLQRRLIRRAWTTLHGTSTGLTLRHVTTVLQKILAGTTDSRLDLPGGVCVFRKAGQMIVEDSRLRACQKAIAWSEGIVLPVPGEVVLGKDRSMCADLVGSEGGLNPGHQTDPWRIEIDAAQAEALVVRSWRPGDWFCPTGMGGRRKKLQDFFVDQKVPRESRHRVPLVVAPAGIVWVVGYRGDERFQLRSESVSKVVLSVVGSGGGSSRTGPPPAVKEGAS